jgi:tetratricopeptide (TPR) repeat protein
LRLIFLNILLCLFLNISSAKPGDSLINLADSLYNDGFYDEAITEYYRFLFFNRGNEDSSGICSKMAFAYANLGEWEKAIAAVDKSIRQALDDSIREQRILDKAVIELAADGETNLKSMIKQIYSSTPYANIKCRAGMILLLTAVLNHNWQSAFVIYQALPDSSRFDSEELEMVLLETRKTNYKSSTAAILLSAIIPGAGQVYTGKWLAGLNALALNAGLGYLTADDLLAGNHGTGIFLFLFLFQRYYAGNIYQANSQAVEHNEAIDKNFEQEILRLLRNSNSGR